jgi:hypothetical protein
LIGACIQVVHRIATEWTSIIGVGTNRERFSGYDSTTTARMIAGTHDEAVALLKEYDPNFNPLHIVKSQRGGIEYIVAEKQA